MTTLRRVFLGLVPLVLLAACQSSGSTTRSFEIPFTQFTLDNGLDVILHQDSSDPIVAIATLIHVGSSREKPGKTGFAHFFEHMSFNDSENVPRGANRKMIGELGGTRNGGTWTDGTIYYEVVPKDAFEKLLWIDSDRLGFMINTVTESALENEKQVVKNEKRQRVDNRPYGHTRSIIPRQLYPSDHPYSWTVIGSLEDLQAATLDDVREFYDRYYGAANATLVIAGDIDVDRTRGLVEQWFGEIRRGPDAEPLKPRPVSLSETKSVYHVDNFAKLPELRMVFPTVEQFHADSYALDALARILSDGKRAPLYNVIVEEQELAPEVDAGNSSNELAGSFTIRVRAKPGVDLDLVKSGIEASLARFEEAGFLEKDLLRIKAEAETDFYNSVSSVLGKAFQLARYNEFVGDPGYATEEIERIQSVTHEDVLGVYERYIKGKHHVMTSFVPRGEEQLIVEGATRAEVFEEQVEAGAEKKVPVDPDFEYEKTETKLDRSEPPLGPPPVLDPPEIWTTRTESGMRVLGIEHRELPLVEFTLRLKGGHAAAPPDKAGLAWLLGELMNEGTRNRTPEQLEDAIGELGANLSVRAGREGVVVAGNGLARHFPTLMNLVVEMLLEPRWDETEFERLKSAQLTDIRQREGDPQRVADQAFNRVLYGDDHIFSLPTRGTTETVSGITLEDLQTFYEKNFSPSVTAFHVAGSVNREEVLKSLQALDTRWKPKGVEFPTYSLPASPAQPVVYFIDVPGSKQSILYVGSLALKGTDDAYNNLVYANDRLGAGSSARLTQLLRIEKGYTYGARSYVSRRLETAPFVASTSVRANVTLESLQLLREQLRNYHDTFLQEDLDTTKNLVIKRATRAFETLDDLVSVLEDISTFDLPLDFIEQNQQELLGLTLEDVRKTIATYIDESRMIYVVVGDGETQLGRIKELGCGDPILLDVHGRPLG